MAFPTWLYTLKNRLEHCQSQRTGRRRALRKSAMCRLASEQLEVRLVLSATFGGALSIGNGTGNSDAYDVATDGSGNSYMTGSFSGTVDFDQTAAVHLGDTDILTARGGGDAYVAKYAQDNSLLWVQRMGNDNLIGSDTGNTIAVDGVGNVYVAGHYYDIDATISADRDGFVAQLRVSDGAIIWTTYFGTPDVLDHVEGVGIDSAKNVYTLSQRSDSNQEVRKFNSNGGLLWTKSITTNQFLGGDLAVSASGNVFVASVFLGTVDFDPGPKTYNISSNWANTNGFVLKLDTNGKFGWVSPFLHHSSATLSARVFARSVALDSSGNVVVGGHYYGLVDFDPSPGTTSLPTIGGAFITKLNSSGRLVWARSLETSSFAFVRGVAVDAADSIYATGDFQGIIDLNPSAASDARASAGGKDIFVVKLTAAGNYSWAETFGGTGDDIGFGIAVDTAGTVHIAGYYQNTIDFDPDPLSTYYLTAPGTFRNAFLLKLKKKV